MSKETGGAAFPVIPPVGLDDTLAVGYPEPAIGMTLRDYFAAKAMLAVISEPPFNEGSTSVAVHLTEDFTGGVAQRYARAAYILADAMLEARK